MQGVQSAPHHGAIEPAERRPWRRPVPPRGSPTGLQDAEILVFVADAAGRERRYDEHRSDGTRRRDGRTDDVVVGRVAREALRPRAVIARRKETMPQWLPAWKTDHRAGRGRLRRCRRELRRSGGHSCARGPTSCGPPPSCSGSCPGLRPGSTSSFRRGAQRWSFAPHPSPRKTRRRA